MTGRIYRRRPVRRALGSALRSLMRIPAWLAWTAWAIGLVGLFVVAALAGYVQ